MIFFTFKYRYMYFDAGKSHRKTNDRKMHLKRKNESLIKIFALPFNEKACSSLISILFYSFLANDTGTCLISKKKKILSSPPDRRDFNILILLIGTGTISKDQYI